uniref:Beta-lactamase-like protein n=1 Tax=uncultured bacterium UPO76 TaxID=1776993 RepID=A0A140E004_9BACT|nr:beta-lactamase-like protein [uncultured bacterium UPO76]
MAFEEITPAEANRRLDEFHVLDVRAEHEFQGPLGRVPGASLLPLPELEARAAELPTSRPLLVVCRSGARSGKACQLLTARGIAPVANLAGGMIAWNRAQLPIEHTDPGSLKELLALVMAWLSQVGPWTPEAVRELVRERLEEAGSSFEAPSHAALDRALDFLEESFAQAASSPPDLDLSLTAFRRSLAVL